MNLQERKKILQDIFEYFQQITQWLPNNIDIANENMIKAESLITLLEVEDCGSVGGFDPDSPVKYESGFSLYDRFLALVNKHDTKIKKTCYFSIGDLKKYFKTISELREIFNK